MDQTMTIGTRTKAKSRAKVATKPMYTKYSTETMPPIRVASAAASYSIRSIMSMFILAWLWVGVVVGLSRLRCGVVVSR